MKTITVNEEEVLHAAADAVSKVIIDNPTRMLIHKELCNVMGCMVAILFKDIEESEG